MFSKQDWVAAIRQWPTSTIVGVALGFVATSVAKMIGIPTLDQLEWPVFTGLSYLIIFFVSSFLFVLLIRLAPSSLPGLFHAAGGGDFSVDAAHAAPLARVSLQPQQQRLLQLLADEQRRRGATKLVIGRRTGIILGSVDASNLADQLGISDGAESARFEPLMESLPLEYVRFFPESRFGSPFVLAVTDQGFRYLEDANTSGSSIGFVWPLDAGSWMIHRGGEIDIYVTVYNRSKTKTVKSVSVLIESHTLGGFGGRTQPQDRRLQLQHTDGLEEDVDPDCKAAFRLCTIHEQMPPLGVDHQSLEVAPRRGEEQRKWNIEGTQEFRMKVIARGRDALPSPRFSHWIGASGL